MLFRYVPAVVYSALIVALSNIPKLSPPEIGFYPGDKILHFVEYFVFALLWYRAFSYSLFKLRIPVFTVLIVYGGVFAALDEYHQNFIPMREMDIWDFTADLGGLLIAALVFHFWGKFKNKSSAKITAD